MDEITGYADKIVAFLPQDRQFTNDEGQKIEYSVFEVSVMVNGTPFTFDVKCKSIEDKKAILALADDK